MISVLNGAGAASAGFLRWWGRTLAGMVPSRLRNRVGRGVLRLEVEAGAFTLFRGDRMLCSGTLDADRMPLPRGVRWDLVVGGQDVLWRPATVPAAAEHALARVVSYSLHRLTPFRLADIRHGCRAVRRDLGAGTITVMVGILARERVRDIVEASGASAPPARLWLRDEEGNVVLAGSDDGSPADRGRKLSLAAVAAAVVAGTAVLVSTEGRWDREADALALAIAEARARAEDVAALERRLEAVRLRSSYAVDLRRDRPLMVETLASLTDRLPDDVWLDFLELDGASVRLSGEGPSAVAVLTLMESSAEFSDARFAAPVTPVPDGGGERFSIVASRVGGGNDRD